MAKDRFVPNLFSNLELSEVDKTELQALVTTIIDEHLPRYQEHTANEKRQVDTNRWKLFKTKDDVRLYSERNTKDKSDRQSVKTARGEEQEPANMAIVLCEGSIPGKLDDVMYGMISPTLELMRLKASYIDDISSASVLDDIVKPTPEDPLRSISLNWMQLNLPLNSMNLVKNRDFVYMEATGFLRLKDGEQIGYHLQHSISLPEAPELPNLVRGNCHWCAFYRQERDLVMEMYATGACDPGGPVLKSLVMHPFATMILSCTDFAHCGEMKKLTWVMQRRNAQKKEMGTKRNDDKCVSCSIPVSHSRIGKLSTTRGSCKLCFNAVCRSCRVRKLLAFKELDLKYEKRKVTFCPVCVKDALNVSALHVARSQILTPNRQALYRSECDFSMTSSNSC